MSKTGVVLLFDRQTDDLACQHAGRIDREHVVGDFLPLGRGAFPHLSLYHLVLLPHKLEAACRLVDGLGETIVADGRALWGTFSSIRRFGQAIFWLAARTPELDRLHDLAVDTLGEIRHGDVSISWAMNEDQQEMRRLHGFPLVKRCFNPHITLAVLKPDFVADPANRHRYENEAARYYHATSIALGPLGPHGQLNDVWYRHELKV